MSVQGFDVRIAVRAAPLLTEFNAAGVLSSADVHVARRLGRLGGESDERVLLAVALAVRAVRAGSVCVELADLDALSVPDAEDALPVGDLPWPDPDGWQAAIEASPLVAVGVDGPDDRPVRWLDGRLYLDRYWRHEQAVRHDIDARLAAGPILFGTALAPTKGAGTAAADGGSHAVDLAALATAVRRRFPDDKDDRQRLAAATAVLSRLTVLTGGPGTGKTTTVARVLAVLQAVAGTGGRGGLRIALAAPTGKAAARLQEAVRAEVARLDDDDKRRVGTPEATTVHRLLGWKPGTSTRFRHDRDHHLPHDVVVVDETSMVSLPLMARLLEALRPDARLLLVGDPDQLASVEAGAVLGDLVARPPVSDGLPAALRAVLPDDVPRGEPTSATDPQAPPDLERLRNGVVRLQHVYRHGTSIGRLAAAVREGRPDEALDVLRSGDPAVEFVETADERPSELEIAGLRRDAESAGAALVAAARAGDAAGALRALEEHRLLLAHRRGPAGVAYWAARVEAWVTEAAGGSGVDGGAVSGAGVPDGGAVSAVAAPVGRARSSAIATAAAAGWAAAAPAAAVGPWYPGRPLLVTTNDRDTGLYNGDTGVVVADGAGGLVAVFGDPERPVEVRPHRLPAVETVHAMTVHRGQGSQFAAVSLLLPVSTSPLLTRELLYTAVTRARQRVRVVGTEAAVRAAVDRPVRRASGLRHPLR